jgi:E3 ubiquitin-protein ligase RNF115/126
MENLNITIGKYWCFICNEECRTNLNEEGPICSNCGSTFVEEIEKDENNIDNPRNFVPQRNNNVSINSSNQSNVITNNPNQRMFFLQLSRNSNGQVHVVSNQSSNNIQQWMQQFNSLFNINPLININSFNFTNDFFPNLLTRQNNDQQLENLLNYLMMNDPNRYGNPPASKKVVDELERVKLTEENIKEYKALNCPLCMEDCNLDDMLLKLKCGHGYHENCILEWLKITNTCPICRDELLTDDPDYENRKNERRRILRSYPNRGNHANSTNYNDNHNSSRPHRNSRG